jgi:very-short-patch-repair endonuclease
MIRSLPAEDVVTDESGLRVTSAARTAVDLAAELDLPRALMVTDCVARQEVLRRRSPKSLRGPLDPLLADLSVASMRKASKNAITRRTRRRITLALDLTDPRHESPGESFSFGHIYLAGLPLPTPQAPISTSQGTFFSDFVWEELKVAAEVDGKVKYGTLAYINEHGENESLVQQSTRESLVRGAGWDVMRWLFSKVLYMPDNVIRELWQRLVSRGCRGPLRPRPGAHDQRGPQSGQP